MKTKVFISWSGDTSKKIAEALRRWIPGVLQIVEPYFTPNDIEKGARWSADIADQLQSSKVGIFCLTRENLNSKWILFEAGAISKNLSNSFVCPILFDIEPSDLEGPLNQFQVSKFNREDMFKLVKTINNACGVDGLEGPVLEDVFDKWWEYLEKDIRNVLSSVSNNNIQELRSDRKLLEEVLLIARRLNDRGVSNSDAIKSLLSNLQYRMTHDLRGALARAQGLHELFLYDFNETDEQRKSYILKGKDALNRASDVLLEHIRELDYVIRCLDQPGGERSDT